MSEQADSMKELSVWAALWKVGKRYLKKGAVTWAVLGSVWGVVTALDDSSLGHLWAITAAEDLWMLAIVLGILVSIGAMLVFPASVWQAFDESRREVRRRTLEAATEQLGSTPPDEIELSSQERFAQLIKDSSPALLAGALFEAFLLSPFLLNAWFLYELDGSYSWSVVMFILMLALLIPVFASWSLWRDSRSEETSSSATARAERAYREAVKDHEQLAGGLALDEHARQAGGDLTVQQEAGGLEVHEEVALGFDVADEEAEATSSEVASTASVGRAANG